MNPCRIPIGLSLLACGCAETNVDTLRGNICGPEPQVVWSAGVESESTFDAALASAEGLGGEVYTVGSLAAQGFVARFDAQGNQVWWTTVDAVLVDQIAVAPNGTLYVAGANYNQEERSGRDGWYAILSADGAVEFAEHIVGDGRIVAAGEASDRISGLTTTPTGGWILTGSEHIGDGEYRGFVTALSSEGDSRWSVREDELSGTPTAVLSTQDALYVAYHNVFEQRLAKIGLDGRILWTRDAQGAAPRIRYLVSLGSQSLLAVGSDTLRRSTWFDHYDLGGGLLRTTQVSHMEPQWSSTPTGASSIADGAIVSGTSRRDDEAFVWVWFLDGSGETSRRLVYEDLAWASVTSRVREGFILSGSDTDYLRVLSIESAELKCGKN